MDSSRVESNRVEWNELTICIHVTKRRGLIKHFGQSRSDNNTQFWNYLAHVSREEGANGAEKAATESAALPAETVHGVLELDDLGGAPNMAREGVSS